MNRIGRRTVVLKGALAALALGAGLLASPGLARSAYGEVQSCTARCQNGSCTVTGQEGEACGCTCDAWTGVPRCACGRLKTAVEG